MSPDQVLALVAQFQALPLPQQIVVGTVIAVATLVIGRFLHNTLFNSLARRPPIFEGVPYVGGLIKFAWDRPINLIRDGYATHGDVFTVPVAHKRITYLVGSDASTHFFRASDDELSQTEVYNFNVPTFGPGVVYDVEQKVRLEQFKWFTDALKTDRLKEYVPAFIEEAEMYFAKWGNEGVVDFRVELSKLIILTAARTLLGHEVREQMFDEVADLLRSLDEGMLPISVFFPYAPIEAHRKRDKACAELRSIFRKIIRNRRAHGTRGKDVLQQFIDARYSPKVNGGRPSSEDEITGLLIAVLFAGQHTSAMTSTWTGFRMVADKKKSFARAVEEQKDVMRKHGNHLDFDILQGMEVMHRNIMEALRMNPPLVMLMRYAKEPFEVTNNKGQTFTVPRGDVVAVSPSFHMMLDDVFTNPDKYDPDRFAAGREEDKTKPFGYIGFGGGRHSCMGANFAYTQIKAIWSVLLRNFDFEMIDPVPEADYESMVIAPKPCRVRYVRRKLTV